MLPLFLTLIITGISLGALYSIVALGFSVVWGTAEIVNTSLSSVAVLSSYISFWSFTLFGESFLLLTPFIVLFSAVVNLLLSIYLDSVLTRMPPLYSLMAYFGLGYTFQGIIAYVWGVRQRTIIMPLLDVVVFLGVPLKFFIVIGVMILFFVAFWLFLVRTKPGLAIRAVSQNKKGALVSGINVKRTYMLAQFLAGIGAGVSGVFISFIYSFSPATASLWIAYMFLIVVVGGLGSVLGSAVAGILLGLIQTVTSYIMPSLWADVIVYVVLIGVLLVLPKGIGELIS